MGHELSLLCSQEAVTCPYNEPNQSVPVPPFYFRKIHFNIILSSMPSYHMWSLSLSFLHEILHTPTPPLPICATCPVHLTLLDLIT
jgi:hypothetical protein